MIDQAARSIEKDAVVFPHLPDVARAPELPLDVFAARLARATVKSLTPRQQLFLEGDHKANIYQVLVGAFVLYRLLPNGRRQVTGFALTGDMVGLGAGTCHRCSAAASGGAKVRALPAIALHRMANEDSHLGMRLYDAMSQELATTQDQLMTLGRLNAAERVATFLLSMSERNARALRPATASTCQ